MIVQKEVMLLVGYGILLIGITGCGGPPLYGVIERQTPLAVGTFAPDIPFVSSEGKRVTLDDVRRPVTILAFVETPGDSCGVVKPELAALSAEFQRLPVSVVQIFMPTGPCSHTATDRHMRGFKNHDPILLCDRDRVAWNSYGQPPLGTVIVVNRRGTMVEVSDMNHLRLVARKVDQLAMEVGSRRRGQ